MLQAEKPRRGPGGTQSGSRVYSSESVVIFMRVQWSLEKPHPFHLNQVRMSWKT